MTDLVATRLTQLDDYVSQLACSHDGTHLAAASLAGDGVIMRDGELARKLTNHPMGILSMAWSPKSDVLATGGQDHVLRLSTREGDLAAFELSGWVDAVAWSPSHPLLAVAAGRDVLTIRTEDAPTRDEDVHRHDSTVTSLAWSPNGRRVAAGSYGGVWFYEDGAADAVKHFSWKGAVLALAVAPNGKWIASGNQDNSVHVWRLWSGDDMQMSGYAGKILHLAFDDTSRYLATGDIGDITLWDFSGRGPNGSTPKQLAGQTRHTSGLAWHGRRIVSASADGSVYLWNPSRPGTKLEAEVTLNAEISCITWRPDGGAIFCGTSTGDVHLLTLHD